MAKVDLKILFRLTHELDAELKHSETVANDNLEYLVSMSKAEGIAGKIYQEALLLVKDISALSYKGGDSAKNVNDILDMLGKATSSNKSNN